MALVDDLIAEVQLAGYDDYLAAEIVELLNDVLQTFATVYVCDYYRSTATVSVTASSSTLSLPADTFAVRKIYDPSTGNVLVPIDKDDLVLRFGGQLTDTGDPVYYYQEGAGYKCSPICSTTRNVTVDYSRIPAAMAVGGSTIDLPVQHKRMLVLGAIVECAILEGDLDMAPGYEAAFDKKVQKVLRAMATENKLDRPDHVHDVYWNDDYF